MLFRLMDALMEQNSGRSPSLEEERQVGMKADDLSHLLCLLFSHSPLFS